MPAEPAAAAAAPLQGEPRYADVVETAMAALAQTSDPAQTAALWSVVAMARQTQGEESEARVALEAAISVAPAAERPRYLQQLASLAESVARACLADAGRRAGAASEERLGALRGAMMWLDCVQAAAPGATALAELIVEVDALLRPEWERTVMMLAQRQDYRAARRLLREALADPRFPPGRAETFRSLFSGTFSGELGQLTARAIKSVQDARDADALAALRRAEHLLGALSDEALSVRRREEVDRRLWWGYRALGERWLAGGAYEDALEPLFHAFGYPVGPEPREETRALLLRALDGVADTRALGIRELADAGEHEAAVVQCDELWALLRDASDMGLSRGDLSGVHGKVQRLFETLGR
jgi:tetratricopeptide (TPR) repeat protein